VQAWGDIALARGGWGLSRAEVGRNPASRLPAPSGFRAGGSRPLPSLREGQAQRSWALYRRRRFRPSGPARGASPQACEKPGGAAASSYSQCRFALRLRPSLHSGLRSERKCALSGAAVRLQSRRACRPPAQNPPPLRLPAALCRHPQRALTASPREPGSDAPSPAR
jgi:hypothetical protein